MKVQSAVELRNVRKTYMMGEVDLDILKGVSLNVGKGEFLSIVGPSGSGK